MTIAELFAKLTIKPDKRSFDAADKAIGFLKSALLGLVAIQTGRFFAGLVADTTAAGDHAAKLAQKTGTTIEEIQELGYAAGQSGSNIDAMSTTLIKLSKNIFDATHGNKELAKSFGRAGIALRNADGSLRPASDVLGDIADHVSSMPDGTKKTAVAMELLGKSGADMIPLLNGGSEGIGELREEARELGAVISEDTAKSLEEFGDEQDRVKTALAGLRNEAVAALLPTLKEMVSGVLAWVKANKEVLKQKLVTVFKLLAAGIKIFAKAVSVVITVLDFMGRHLDVVAVAVLALVTALGIFRAASIASAIASGIAWALSVMPILLLAALLAAVILIIEDLYMWFTGGESVLKDLYNAAAQYLTWDKIAEKIKEAFGAALDWVADKARSVWDSILGSGDLFNRDAQARLLEAERLGLEGEDRERFMSDDNHFGMRELNDRVNGAPTINLPTSESTAGPSFVATVNIDGAKGSPEENAKAMTAALDDYWQGQMRKAAATGGVR